MKMKYAGMFCGEKIYLEKGERLNWKYKIPIFFLKILPNKLNTLNNEGEKE